MLPFSQPSCSMSYRIWDQRSITGGQHPGISGVAVPGIFFFWLTQGFLSACAMLHHKPTLPLAACQVSSALITALGCRMLQTAVVLPLR